MAINQLIHKHVLPANIIVGSVIACIVAGTIVIAKEDFKYRNYQTSNAKATHTALFSTLTVLMALLLIFLLSRTYKQDYEFAESVARKYLKHIVKEHPELKDFKQIYNNQNAMRNVATMIANSMTKEEQNKIMIIIYRLQMHKGTSEKDELAAVNSACNQIVEVIKHHAAKDPEFINSVYKTINCVNTTYVMSAAQNVRG